MLLLVAVVAVLATARAAFPLPGRVTGLPVAGFNASQTVFSGLLPLSSTNNNSALFFKFFEAQSPSAAIGATPLILWMNGGPGSTSDLGLFYENGPYGISPQLSLVPRAVNWNTHYHLFYLDQPRGTGLSVLGPGDSHVKNETEVADDVHDAFLKFRNMFPAYASCPLFVAGESYGGHYVPSVAHRFMQDPTVPLKGLAVGNGFSDPCLQIPMAPNFARELGMMSSRQHALAMAAVAELEVNCRLGQRDAAFVAVGAVLGLIIDDSGGVNRYDFRTFSDYNYTLLEQAAFHAQAKTYVSKDNGVFWALTGDQIQSMAPKYTDLLQAGVQVLIYHGQTDICFTNAGDEAFADSIEWAGAPAFRNASRAVWHVAGAIAGYARQHQNLRFVNVLEAGHLVPMDQPGSALDMISRFIENRPFN